MFYDWGEGVGLTVAYGLSTINSYCGKKKTSGQPTVVSLHRAALYLPTCQSSFIIRKIQERAKICRGSASLKKFQTRKNGKLSFYIF